MTELKTVQLRLFAEGFMETLNRNPGACPDRTLSGISVLEFDCPRTNPLTYLGMEIIKYISGGLNLEMDLNDKTFRIYGGVE